MIIGVHLPTLLHTPDWVDSFQPELSRMAAAAAQEARVQRSRTKGRECVACDQDRASKIHSCAALWNLPRLTGSIQIHTNSITSNLIQTSHLSTILQNLLLGSIFKAFTGLVSPLELGSERSPCHLLPSRLDPFNQNKCTSCRGMFSYVFRYGNRWEAECMVGHFCRRLSVGYSVGDGDQATCAEHHDFLSLPTLLRHRFEGMKHPDNKSNNTSNFKTKAGTPKLLVSNPAPEASLVNCPFVLTSGHRTPSMCSCAPQISHDLTKNLRAPLHTKCYKMLEEATSRECKCSITQRHPGWIGTLIIVRQWAFGLPGKTSVVQTSRYRPPWSSHHSTRCVQRAAKGNIQRCSQTKGLKIQIPLDHSVSHRTHTLRVANHCIPRHDHHFDSMAQGSKFWDMNLHVHHQPNLGGDLPWRFSYHQLPSYPVFALVRLWSLSVFRRNRP